MNVKRYQAETWEEVLALVKADLGEKFVVLHTKTFVKGGVLGFGGKEMYEVTATRDAASADQSASAPAREPERLRVDGRQHLARISESIQRLPEASSDERPVRSRTDRIQRTLRRSAAAADLGEQAADARAEDAPAGAAGFGAGRVASRPGRADERAPGRPADRRSGRDAPVGAPPSNAPPAPAGVEREEPAAPSAASRNLTGSRFDAVVAEV
ncbi:MAG: hypothetical protein HY719_00150, partial [Planctomycetes bacterium]|nr:hypothetical protein [Planctomycetota bacterium]